MYLIKLKMTAAVLTAIVAMSSPCGFTVQAGADKPAAVDPLAPEQFTKTHALIKPHPGESRWAEVPWLLSVYDARKKAAAEGKPIFIWAGGGAPPIGIC